MVVEGIFQRIRFEKMRLVYTKMKKLRVERY